MIVINGDMPKNCEECDLQMSCPVHFSAREDKASRHSSCPIIGEIPDEHGDLIDRDKLLFDIVKINCLDDVAKDEILETIQKYPVILEASK